MAEAHVIRYLLRCTRALLFNQVFPVLAEALTVPDFLAGEGHVDQYVLVFQSEVPTWFRSAAFAVCEHSCDKQWDLSLNRFLRPFTHKQIGWFEQREHITDATASWDCEHGSTHLRKAYRYRHGGPLSFLRRLR